MDNEMLTQDSSVNPTPVRDVWAELQSLFEREDQKICEIEFINLDPDSMIACIRYLMNNAKECTCRFVMAGTDMEVTVLSLDKALEFVATGQLSLAMWLTMPALPMLSAFVDFSDEISFGYVAGTWNAMQVLVFFDLLYNLKGIAPRARIRPNSKIFSRRERKKVLDVWQDYAHA